MRNLPRFCAAVALCLCAAGLAGQGRAGEPGNKPDAFGALTPLSPRQLASQRAMGESVATNDLTQTVGNTLTGTTVTGGDITASDSAFANSALSVNMLNTGNNAVLQASSSIIVNITP